MLNANWLYFDTPHEVELGAHFVALTGEDGQIIPGSRLTVDFPSIGEAFSARATMLAQYPNADVYDASAGEPSSMTNIIH